MGQKISCIQSILFIAPAETAATSSTFKSYSADISDADPITRDSVITMLTE